MGDHSSTSSTPGRSSPASGYVSSLPSPSRFFGHGPERLRRLLAVPGGVAEQTEG